MIKEQSKGPPQPLVDWYWRTTGNVLGNIAGSVCTENHPKWFSIVDIITEEHPGLYIPVRTIDKLFGPHLGVHNSAPYWIIEIGRYWHTHTDRLNELLELADTFSPT